MRADVGRVAVTIKLPSMMTDATADPHTKRLHTTSGDTEYKHLQSNPVKEDTWMQA